MELDRLDVVTADGRRFTGHSSARMAWLVLGRFGGDLAVASAAWRRMLESDCPDSEFERLANAGELLVRLDIAERCPANLSRAERQAFYSAIYAL
jgi:hypothetical protein